jgi:uncharacterized protein
MSDDDGFEHEIIDIGPRRRRRWLWVVAAVLLFIFVFGSQVTEVYIDSLWFSSVGFSDVYWYKFKLGALLFGVSLVVTFLAIRLPFILLSRAFPQLTERPRVRLRAIEDPREINLLPYIYRPGVWLVSVVVAFLVATNMTQSWHDFALYLNAQQGGVADPVFHRDIGFYLFQLPVLQAVAGWFSTVAWTLFVGIAGCAGYVWFFENSRGFVSESVRRKVIAAVSAVSAPVVASVGVGAYLGRYDLLSERNALFTGASYADVNAWLPGLYVTVAVMLIAVLLLTINAVVLKRGRLVLWTGGAVVATAVIALLAIPRSVQSFSVNPNELSKESPFMQNNLDMTRRGFAIDRFDEKTFQPAPTLTVEQINENRQTIENVRLWDPGALQSTFSQVQEIRTYYEFRVPDVDRYMIDGRMRQVLLAAREMNVNQLPDQSRNWINQHLVYTHGYGVTMATVNEFTAEGLPHLILKNMPVESDVPSLAVTRPEIYFGEVETSHVYVNTRPQGSTEPEFNYPAPGNIDSYTEYQGKAGIPVGGLVRQTALALFLGDGTKLLLSDFITSESRVLLRRNIVERVRTIAPYLLVDDDPYIVITSDGRLKWIVDAYTYSDRYPYSTAYQVSGQPANYLRNSVKAVVDAYEGDVTFYVFDKEDPIIRAYQKIFPSLYVSGDQMPADLRAHTRYPELLAETQGRVYELYHMTSPQTFYNREDAWSIAAVEPAGQQGFEPAPIKPYFVVMRLPGEQPARVEFLNILPFTPTGPGRNNMIGWLAARSDGDEYGKTLVYAFPKNLTVNGPAQIKARINQDAQLSQQITLWNQQGSKILRGNLQVIPVADSLLYVEPFYLQAENSPLPELRQVAVATQDRLAAAKTFDEALRLLMTELTSKPNVTSPAPGQEARSEAPPPPAQSQATAPASAEMDRLARQAQQLFSDYERLTSEGKYREAGDKLDQIKKVISDMNRRRGG